MKKIISLLLVIVTFNSCRYNAGIATSEGVRDILISITEKHGKGNGSIKQTRLSHVGSIKRIIRELNNCKPEPVKFYPTHTLLIEYENNKVINITCNGDGLMDNDGNTYVMRKTIEEILGE